jgi:hypothetical protein
MVAGPLAEVAMPEAAEVDAIEAVVLLGLGFLDVFVFLLVFGLFIMCFVFLDVYRDFLLDVHRDLDGIGLRDRDLYRIGLGNANGMWHRHWYFDLDPNWIWYLLHHRVRYLLMYVHRVGLFDVHRDGLLDLDLIRYLDRVWDLLLDLHRIRVRDRNLDFLVDGYGLYLSLMVMLLVLYSSSEESVVTFGTEVLAEVFVMAVSEPMRTPVLRHLSLLLLGKGQGEQRQKGEDLQRYTEQY